MSNSEKMTNLKSDRLDVFISKTLKILKRKSNSSICIQLLSKVQPKYMFIVCTKVSQSYIENGNYQGFTKLSRKMEILRGLEFSFERGSCIAVILLYAFLLQLMTYYVISIAGHSHIKLHIYQDNLKRHSLVANPLVQSNQKFQIIKV